MVCFGKPCSDIFSRISDNFPIFLRRAVLEKKGEKKMNINFGIKTDCPKCNTLNCYCGDNPDYWDEEGEQFVSKDINDFDNVFNYIEWCCETQNGYEMQVWRWEEIEGYIKEILLENHRLEQLLFISQGFDP